MLGKTNLIMIGAAAAVLAVVAGAYVNVIVTGGQGAWGDPMNPEAVARGRAVYDEHCASCHGVELEGQDNWRVRNEDGTLPAPPHDASGHTWHHPDSLLFETTRDGGQKNAPEGFISAMPAFGETLSDEEIWSSLAYIKSRWPEDIRLRQARMTEAARGQ